MFNHPSLGNQSFSIALCAFFVLFAARHLLLKRKISIFIYHVILFCILFFVAVAGVSVQNYGYTRLEKFIELEKKDKLDDAKQNLQSYDSMLAHDLKQFKNSEEFIAYLKKIGNTIDKAQAIFIGWLFVLLSDIAMIYTRIVPLEIAVLLLIYLTCLIILFF